MDNNGILLLADGTIFHGNSVGYKGWVSGEVCFNTGMTGYQEVFTDPSYFGQILVTTNAHTGNYGISSMDNESDVVQISALVCRNFSNQFYSRSAANQSIADYLMDHKKIVLSNVDTRKLVRYIRDKGAMNAIISSDGSDIDFLKKQLLDIPSMEGLELSSKVSTAQAYQSNTVASTADVCNIALLDLGVKKNIVRCLNQRGANVKIFPWNTTFAEIMAFKPDGIMLSNGPGDPSAMSGVINVTKEIINSGIPTFGICLGHQIIALASGLKTYKMHNGHRGINHPVKNCITGRCEVTSQNHGFVVDSQSVQQNKAIEVSHIHLNDNTLAGLRYKNKPIFSVQFHPESNPGPNDSRYLFDQFIENIKQHAIQLA